MKARRRKRLEERWAERTPGRHLRGLMGIRMGVPSRRGSKDWKTRTDRSRRWLGEWPASKARATTFCQELIPFPIAALRRILLRMTPVLALVSTGFGLSAAEPLQAINVSAN